MAAVITVLVVAAAVAAFLLLRKHSTEPRGWSAGPVSNGQNYSPGVVVGADGSFDFPTTAPGVHYVTEAHGPIPSTATITLHYRIDADPGVTFLPTSDPSAQSIGPTLYFQREGDNWSGTGAYETYRWWATFAAPMPITPGDHTIVAPLSARWTAVETSNSDDNSEAFKAALEHCARVGFTFGGGTGYGHGVYAIGNARFTLLEFTVET